MTRSSLLCQAGRYTEAEPILLRCLSQYELTGKQDAVLLSILTNLELAAARAKSAAPGAAVARWHSCNEWHSTVYRREQYNVTKESEIPVFEDLHLMCSSRSLDDIVYQRCKTAIINGGAVFELDNGFTVLVPEKVNPDDWRLAKVRVPKDPTSPLPAMALTNLRTGSTVNGEVLDSR